MKKARYLFGVLFIICLIFIGSYYGKQRRGENLYGELQREQVHISVAAEQIFGVLEQVQEKQEILEEVSVEADKFPHLENTVDFADLQERNDDIYAWIEIPGTQVNYPVVQHPADDAYYLNHTIEGVPGLPGSIYSEKVHPKDFSAVHTVLYGHNMKNGTMFGSLHEYEDAAFFEEHSYVYIHLPECTLVYRIFAAVQFSNAYLPIYRDYEDEAGFSAYVEELKNAPGQANGEAKVPYGSRLLTLSTCIGNDSAHRFLVAAVLAEEYEREEY